MFPRTVVISTFAIAILGSFLSAFAQSCSSVPPYCKAVNSLILRCENFNNFGQLRFTNRSNVCAQLDIRPSKPLLFDHTLDLTGIDITGVLSISNLIGIDVSKRLVISQ
jgi:hypothetical protein